MAVSHRGNAMSRTSGEFVEKYTCGCALKKPSLDWVNLCEPCLMRKREYEKKYKNIKVEEMYEK